MSIFRVSSPSPAKESTPPTTDLQAVLLGLLRPALAFLQQHRELFLSLEVRSGHSGIDLRQCWRLHPRLAHPDEVERDVLELLAERGRSRACDVLSLLDAHNGRTLQRRLTRLVRLGVLDHFTVPPRGYELAPEVNRAALTATAVFRPVAGLQSLTTFDPEEPSHDD